MRPSQILFKGMQARVAYDPGQAAGVAADELGAVHLKRKVGSASLLISGA